MKQAKKWECMTDHANEQLVVKKHNCTFPFEKGTPYIDVLDIPSGQDIDFTGMPPEFFLD